MMGSIMGDKDSGGYLPCLMCDADVPVTRAEVNQSVYCSFCLMSMKLKQKEKVKEDEDDLYFEEDY